SVELFHRVNMQDFDACERCQPAMASKVYSKGGVLVPSEHHISAFHQWVHGKVGDVQRTGEDLLGLTPDTAPLEERARTVVG
ncbi:SRPBCC family protein, partial [Arthrobacter sp. USHLN218]|uniref:SRPBCC family protein n=1 Tax=Arthrobacter sp. USHLN218 TaxID=3081232 RepID=UPI003019669D